MLRILCPVVLIGTLWALPAAAQEAAAPAAPEPGAESADYDEIKGLLDAIQARVERMNQRAEEADAQLNYLDQQVDEAITLLSSRQEENTALRDRTVGLAEERENLNQTQEDLRDQIARLTTDQDTLVAQFEARIEELMAQLGVAERTSTTLRASLTQQQAAYTSILDERKMLNDKLALAEQAVVGRDEEIAGQREQIDTLQQALTTTRTAHNQIQQTLTVRTASLAAAEKSLVELRGEKEDLTAQLVAARGQGDALAETVEALRTQHAKLESALGTEQHRAVTAERELASREQRMAALEETAATERANAVLAQQRMERLTQQLAGLHEQLAVLNGVLEASENSNREREAVIADLQSRLNAALASKVQELARYRSEFFGRLSEVLSHRPEIRTVGDRFVFQSEVLFPTGEARINGEGREELMRFAETLSEIAPTIPDEIDWVLRVDGHTDDRPINTNQFPSNWELSTARATSVVKFLIEQGIPPDRMVAAGFGEFHPLDDRRDQLALQRNRRIEFKLTER